MTNEVLILGWIANILMMAAYIPQIIQMIKTRSTKDISLPTYIIIALGLLFWIFYGLALWQLPIIICNIIIEIFVVIILSTKLVNEHI